MRLLLVAGLAAMLLWEAAAGPPPQVRWPLPADSHRPPQDSKTRGTLGAAQPDTEKAWGAQAMETHEDDPLGRLNPEPIGTRAEEQLPGLDAKAWVEIKDTLSPLRRPQRGPEPDLDSLYHPLSEV
ncbi:proline-rich acidic protein 1 isoform X2 [Dipodomys spectabilis]|uniref:proline-rich acidic protein 1 isoform X2 n=1 Tax=Dipodomys spectabilis TaxID=105255 RepID=UPI001C54898A|nr:proline-rich acidic protein 1 isoform X2 [Dipodomys spectabilis]